MSRSPDSAEPRPIIDSVAGYVLRGGRQGYDRLAVLARDRWPDTRALLEQAGISPGMRCADIGCGGGAVSLEMARLVAPGGTVTGIDMDEVTISMARRDAADRGWAMPISECSTSGTGTSQAAMTRCTRDS
jgi:2-polyprenyl-3-methyl-5-hydroxy-6-metoxy-1,4-benzoquinol methylase